MLIIISKRMLLATLGVTVCIACAEQETNATPPPTISSVQPDVAEVGSQVLVTGSNFGNQSGQLRVVIGGAVVTQTDVVVPGQSIKFILPTMNMGSYGLRVILGNRESNMTSIKVVATTK
jgi:IPT/TIG domain